MYLSKIWFFVVAVFAAVALTFALVMPRPAERTAISEEDLRLKRACSMANILLRDNARIRVQLAGEVARAGAPANEPTLQLGSILLNASRGEIVSAKENETGRRALKKIGESFTGAGPDFMLLIDRRGRVVARMHKEGAKSGAKSGSYGESVNGYFVVDDAIAGYLRDDLWIVENQLFRVAASPVVTPNSDWAGAVVIGHAVDGDFVETIATGLDVSVSFYVGESPVASSNKVAIEAEVVAKVGDLSAIEPGADCTEGTPFQATANGKTYSVLLSRLPGEAGELGAFIAMSVERQTGIGVSGTIGSLKKGDLSPSNFPWILVVLLFTLMVGIGLFLMIWEADRPAKRLADDAQRLSKGGDKLMEDQHRGKFGSIARSVNVSLDRLRREAKSAQKDLDDLLGPVPAGSAPLPNLGPAAMAPPPPPPPSEFKFSDAPAGSKAPAMPPLNLPVPPPPGPAPSSPASMGAPVHAQVPPNPVSLPGALSAAPSPADVAMTVADLPPIVEDMPTIVSEQSQKLASNDAEIQHFRDIYHEFIAAKMSCGEAADKLNFERFATKLRKNRDALIAKHGCRSVRFQVYVKDGKAALKASPEK